MLEDPEHKTVAELTGSSLLIDQLLTPKEKIEHLQWIADGGLIEFD